MATVIATGRCFLSPVAVAAKQSYAYTTPPTKGSADEHRDINHITGFESSMLPSVCCPMIDSVDGTRYRA